MSATASRTARIEARIAPDALETVRVAAKLQGRSMSDFLVSAVLKCAQDAIEEARVIRLSMEDQARFVDALLNPPAPAPALTRAFNAHKRLLGAA